MLSALAAFATWLVNLIVNNYLAIRIFAFTLIAVLLPVILNNFVYGLMETFIGYAQNQINQYGVDTSLFHVYQFSGLAGWLISVFKIPESFSVVISGITTSFVLRTIPFVRW